MAMSNIKNIIHGPEDNLELSKTSMGLFLFECLKKRPFNDVVYEDAFSNSVVSAGCLIEDSVKILNIFINLNLRKNDVVCIVSENSVHYSSILLAGLYMGVILNPLNPEYTIGELQHVFKVTQPKLIICSETALPVVEKLRKNFSFKIVLLSSSNTISDFQSIERLKQKISVDISTFQPKEFDSSQMALILLSSGTSGLPKGVSYTHQNIRGTATIIRYLYLNAKSNCIIQFVPSFHVYGIMLLIGAIINQTKVVIMPKFKTDVFLRSIEQHRVETIFAVPQILQFLATTDKLQNFDVSSVKCIYTGTANIFESSIDLLNERMNGVTILQIYGLTETSGPCVYQHRLKIKFGSVGSLIPGCVAKIHCLKTEQPLGPYKVGEICIKGFFVMSGYFNNDEATKSCIDSDGFLHTGDLGYYDQDNCFYIVDRLKNIIKYKGFQVSPVELENILLQHSSVKECCVVGLPDERAGELPIAFIVVHKEKLVTEKEIVDYVAERISVQKRLHGGVRFLESLPKSATGKIQRHVLQHLCRT